MTGLLARLAGPLVFVAALVAEDVAAQAANYPVSTLTFPSGPISLPNDAIGLPSAPLRFPAESLSFPGSLMRSETSATIEVTLPADVLFDFDKADIRPDAAKTLHEVAQLVREKARGPVTIQGFTDALGNDVYNQRLSERRAAAVRTWLVSHEGLGAVKFAANGFGARNPVAPNRNPDGSDNPEGRQLNRRVTLIIRK
jgi:outer membrane protein OmpA-like peptidoglycan-associated protein